MADQRRHVETPTTSVPARIRFARMEHSPSPASALACGAAPSSLVKRVAGASAISDSLERRTMGGKPVADWIVRGTCWH